MFLAGILLSLCGCLGPRIDWGSRVGSYTYDQAVLELGPPDRKEELSDGTKVVEWLTNRGLMHGSVDTFYGPRFGGPYIQHYSQFPSPDEYLRLTFDPQGRLRNWRNVSR